MVSVGCEQVLYVQQEPEEQIPQMESSHLFHWGFSCPALWMEMLLIVRGLTSASSPSHSA